MNKNNRLNELEKLRKQYKISQYKMAKMINVSLSSYEKIEGGRALAGRKFMCKLKNKFPEANIDEIFFKQ